MLRLPPLRRAALGAALLALGACDAADTDDALTEEDLDDAAVVVASALALDGGGVLEDAALSASLAGSADDAGRSAGPDRPGCDHSRTYDEGAATWTVTIDCARSSVGGRFSAEFARVSTYQFFDADGTAQRERAGAARLEYDIVSGSTLFQSPRGTHALTSLGADLSVTALDDDLVSVNGTYDRAGTDTLRTLRGERTVAYTLALTLDDVQGPKTRARTWESAVGGTITGTLRSVITRTPVGGETVVREVDRSFTVTFPDDGSERVAEITIERRRYRANLATGEIAGL